MGYVIAIAGKGGTGKTTVAALLVRLLKEKKAGSILAVDADPNSNLAQALGIKLKETIGQILDEVAVSPQSIPAGMSKDRFIEYRVQTAVQEGDGFDILSMGRPEGPGCYCYVNNVLRNIVGKLIKDYDYIVLDNEAGLEHLSRRTTREAEVLLVISDATPVGLVAARRIYELVNELKIKTKKNFLVINRSDLKPKISIAGLEYLGSIPEDKEIENASLNGSSLLELDNYSKALEALRLIGGKMRDFKFLIVILTFTFCILNFMGCATGRSKNLEIQGLRNQISVLETQIQAKDAQINHLKETLIKAREETQIKVVSKERVIPEAKSRPSTKQIQIALKNAGFNPGPLDGRIGKQTKEAIRAFQRANNLAVDGKVGKQTWGFLREYLYKKIK